MNIFIAKNIINSNSINENDINENKKKENNKINWIKKLIKIFKND